MDASKFITLINGGNAGAWGHLWRKSEKQSTWFQAGQVPADLTGDDLYFGVHPCAQIPTHSARGIAVEPSKVRGQIKHIASVAHVYAEFDAKMFGKDMAATRAHIDTLPLAPSLIVCSGGGYHCYWLLTEPRALVSDVVRADAQMVQAEWVRVVGGDPDAKDLARVLRVPGTMNTKYDPARPVVLIDEHAERRYTLAELRAVIAANPAPVIEAVATKARAQHRSVTAAVAGAVNTPTARTLAYGYGALMRIAAEDIPAAGDGERHGAALRAGLRLGSLMHLGLSEADVLTHIEHAMRASWSTSENVAVHMRTFRDGLVMGAKSPRTPNLLSAESRDESRAAMAACRAAVARAGRVGTIKLESGKAVRRNTLLTLLTGIVTHAAERGLHGAFFCSHRDAGVAAGINSDPTVAKGFVALSELGVLRDVDRATLKWLRSQPGVAGQGLANCYEIDVLALLELLEPTTGKNGAEQSEARNIMSTEDVCRKGPYTAEAPLQQPTHKLSGPFLHNTPEIDQFLLKCSKLAIRGASIDIIRALALHGPASDADIAAQVPVHRTTMTRALATLSALGLIEQGGETGAWSLKDRASLEDALGQIKAARAQIETNHRARIDAQRRAHAKRLAAYRAGTPDEPDDMRAAFDAAVAAADVADARFVVCEDCEAAQALDRHTRSRTRRGVHVARAMGDASVRLQAHTMPAVVVQLRAMSGLRADGRLNMSGAKRSDGVASVAAIRARCMALVALQTA